ncbi:MAG: prephenate dehydrogenase/arogenate dehydrogenase family protein [Kiritimatiellia bacterium]|nr:prephenate dehydrogenase/arogenate dehydrogenase family protein [Kiritimatiellia bacterium]
MPKTINIIGLGLIGTSLARDAIRTGWEVHGFERDPGNRATASAILKRPVEPLEAPLPPADLTALCTPPADILDRLPRLLDAPPGAIFDVASVKTPIAKAVARHPNRARYVSAHPMAGRELSGPRAAIDALFRNRPCLFCDTDHSAPSDYAQVRAFLLNDCAMFPAEMSSEAHDRHVAVISHIPHILAFVLNNLVWTEPDVQPQLGGTGLDGMIRLAKSDPLLWRDILATNAQALDAPLAKAIDLLSQIRNALQTGDADALARHILRRP